MNAFGEALNLGFMRGSGDFSSGSMPMDSISGCIPMSSYSSANESQDCIPMSSSSPAYGLKTQTAFP